LRRFSISSRISSGRFAEDTARKSSAELECELLVTNRLDSPQRAQLDLEPALLPNEFPQWHLISSQRTSSSSTYLPMFQGSIVF